MLGGGVGGGEGQEWAVLRRNKDKERDLGEREGGYHELCVQN